MRARRQPREVFVETLRDLIVLRINKTYLTVSCDSCGGVGFNPLDTLKVKGVVLGRFLARVALMETLSVNAQPLACSLTLSINPSPAWKGFLAGVHGEFKAAGLKAYDVKFILSSEKNFPVRQTGVGITILGATRSLKIGRVERGDLLVAVGKPHVGREVLKAETGREIADLRDLNKLLKTSFVHEIIPVGSQGILHEAKVLAKSSGLNFKPFKSTINLKKPAGPSTVILAAVEENKMRDLAEHANKPLTRIGFFT
ncbi:hypothetical protein [Candidatus Hecatella orcuttiae]|uniref:hypothetical protein n=1 Tax=Candidatus Hecatella orcuttiae TaxID=1935119 RepID=UPI0028680ED7|nr:hypothetical protein [Candidatus Hecatella orcuttiae]